MQPRLLLLGEVTSAPYPELAADVLDLIRERAEGGMTMLIATHEMGFAHDTAGGSASWPAGRSRNSRRPRDCLVSQRTREPGASCGAS